MSKWKETLGIIVSYLVIAGLVGWYCLDYQKRKDFAYFASIPRDTTRVTDTLWLPPPPPITTENIDSDIEYLEPEKEDTLRFIAYGDTVDYADGARIAPTYIYPENKFALWYQPAPPKIITMTVTVPSPYPVEVPPSFWEKVQYAAYGAVAAYILRETLFSGNR